MWKNRTGQDFDYTTYDCCDHIFGNLKLSLDPSIDLECIQLEHTLPYVPERSLVKHGSRVPGIHLRNGWWSQLRLCGSPEESPFTS